MYTIYVIIATHNNITHKHKLVGEYKLYKTRVHVHTVNIIHIYHRIL